VGFLLPDIQTFECLKKRPDSLRQFLGQRCPAPFLFEPHLQLDFAGLERGVPLPLRLISSLEFGFIDDVSPEKINEPFQKSAVVVGQLALLVGKAFSRVVLQTTIRRSSRCQGKAAT